MYYLGVVLAVARRDRLVARRGRRAAFAFAAADGDGARPHVALELAVVDQALEAGRRLQYDI